MRTESQTSIGSLAVASARPCTAIQLAALGRLALAAAHPAWAGNRTMVSLGGSGRVEARIA